MRTEVEPSNLPAELEELTRLVCGVRKRYYIPLSALEKDAKEPIELTTSKAGTNAPEICFRVLSNSEQIRALENAETYMTKRGASLHLQDKAEYGSLVVAAFILKEATRHPLADAPVFAKVEHLLDHLSRDRAMALMGLYRSIEHEESILYRENDITRKEEDALFSLCKTLSFSDVMDQQLWKLPKELLIEFLIRACQRIPENLFAEDTKNEHQDSN